MKKIVINNVEFNDFGSNNYTNGMHLIGCYPVPANIVQDILSSKFPNVWLNPSAECGNEFYGFLGTKEQYEKVYNTQKKALIAKKIMDYFDCPLYEIPLEEFKEAEERFTLEYKDWWIN